MTARLVNAVEAVLFTSRWLLAPLYVGLIGGLLAVLVKFSQSIWTLSHHVIEGTTRSVTLEVLELVDITLLGNLIVLVMFVGYENFVSRLNSAEGSVDRPTWLGHVDYSGLKLKLIGSLVAISAIELLRDFLAGQTGDIVVWRIALHMTFVFSGLIFAVTDRLEHGRKAPA